MCDLAGQETARAGEVGHVMASRKGGDTVFAAAPPPTVRHAHVLNIHEHLRDGERTRQGERGGR